jgi:YggT family protein
MFIVGNFVIALARMLDLILSVLYWLILIRAFISWVNPDPFNPIVQFLYRTTEPILDPIRRILPPMGIDLSPLLAFFVLIFVKSFLIATLFDIGVRFKAY